MKLFTPPASVKLCLVLNNWAFFSTTSPKQQSGRNWGKAPYEYWACEPQKGAIHKVAFTGMIAPCEFTLSGYSVEQINQGAIPWLMDKKESAEGTKITIYPGASFKEFCEKVWEAQGEVYGKLGGQYE